MHSVIGERGQVTIPKKFRENMGLLPGTQLEFRQENGRLFIEKIWSNDPVEAVTGCLARGVDTDEVMKELRGEL